ncbi:MATE family efflux transporter [Vibrio lentus]|nr:MATE family efflux transporter [Vibrio lentus]
MRLTASPWGLASAFRRVLVAYSVKAARKMRLAFTCHGLLLAVLLVGFASTLGLATLEPMFALLGAGKPELLPLISEYMSVWYLAIPLLVIPMAGNSAIRASGDTKTPAKIMILAGLINGAFSTRC